MARLSPPVNAAMCGGSFAKPAWRA